MEVSLSGAENRNIGIVINSRSCSKKLDEIKSSGKPYDKIKLEKLYNDYNSTNLLNFDNPSCSNNNDCMRPTSDCLSFNLTKDDSFNENNLSCYTSKKEENTKIGYCLTSFNFDKVSSYKPKTPYSGQLYFKVNDSRIMTGNFNQICYFIEKPYNGAFPIEKGDKISDYITNVKLTGIDNLPMTLTDDKIKLVGSDGKYEYSKNISFDIPEVWVNFSGKKLNEKCNDGNCTSLGYGLISRLNDSGIKDYNFLVSYRTDINKSKSKTLTFVCTYNSKKQLIKNEKLEVEFRTIDINYPFVNKEGNTRNTMTNWCYNEGSKLEKLKKQNEYYYKANNEKIETSCSYDNMLVKENIYYAPSSYGVQKTVTNERNNINPKYKILLTQDVVNKIKEYSNTNNIRYDSFNLNCNNDKCTSKLLNYLKENRNLVVN